MDKPFALIIEDDRDIAALFRHVLDIAGYHTEVVMHGKEALTRLGSVKPDIVLLDLSLPGVPGAKILETMKARSELQSVPVIVVTAYSQIADSLAIEPDLVLLKPVNLDQLSNLVQRLRATQGAVRESPWDQVTHLYNQNFFKVRLTYSLERARQLGEVRFGVLFIDLGPGSPATDEGQGVLTDQDLHEIAMSVKTILRPTDTIARFNTHLFLVLLEDIRDETTPIRIAARIKAAFKEKSFAKSSGSKQTVGVLVCDASYQSAEEILKDVDTARSLARQKEGGALFDKESLRQAGGSLTRP